MAVGRIVSAERATAATGATPQLRTGGSRGNRTHYKRPRDAFNDSITRNNSMCKQRVRAGLAGGPNTQAHRCMFLSVVGAKVLPMQPHSTSAN